MKFIEKPLRNLFFNKLRPNFEKGGKWEKFYPVYEAQETLFFVPNHTAPKKGAQIRDAVDMKRMMVTVIVAMIPCLIFGMYNVGLQHYLATNNPEYATFGSQLLLGAVHVLPIVAVSYIAGLAVEFIFGVIRKHPINEGFLVTGMLIPLVVPVTIPLWMVALATVFAVILGKEVFGGTGFNILNPALTARAFLFFAYPTDMSGDICWVLTDSWFLADGLSTVDGWTGATALAHGATAGVTGTTFADALASNSIVDFSAMSMFMGTIPGSVGETSTLMCLLGAFILVITGVGSMRVMLSVFVGGAAMALLYNAIGGPGGFDNPFMQIDFYYHWVMGGFAFGAVFMATDPVSASQTNTGKIIYGFLIGLIAVLIRVSNPAYPEGMMMAILLMNVFAPLIDFYVVEANKKRRLKRATV